MIIFIADNSNCGQFEANQKGLRNDIFVKIEDSFYNINAITLNRLYQEVSDTFQNGDAYDMEFNMIIINQLTNEELIKAILINKESGYFSQLKPSYFEKDKVFLCLNDKVKEIYLGANWPICYKLNELVKIYEN